MEIGRIKYKNELEIEVLPGSARYTNALSDKVLGGSVSGPPPRSAGGTPESQVGAKSRAATPRFLCMSVISHLSPG